MRCIIAGSRDIHDYALLERAIAQSGFAISEVVSGACRGVDLMGERWAREYSIPVKRFPYLGQYGKMGGPIRNKQMAEYGEALIALPSGTDSGTHNMIAHMRAHGKPVFVPEVEG